MLSLGEGGVIKIREIIHFLCNLPIFTLPPTFFNCLGGNGMGMDNQLRLKR